jgi:glycosyltransferase involved in cell wall biosynthesis
MIRRLVSNVDDPIRCLFLAASSGDAAIEREGLQLIHQIGRDGIVAEVGVLHESSQAMAEFSDSMPIHSQILADKNDLSVWRRLPKMLSDGRYEAVVTIGGGAETFWGRLGALRCELPVVMSYVRCNSDINWGNALQEMLASGTDRFLCESPAIAATVEARFAIPVSRVETLSLGVDTENHRPHTAERAEMRYAMGLPSSVSACGFVVRPDAIDGLKYMFEASRWTISQATDFRLVLLGVPQTDVPKVEQQIAERRLSERVIVRPEAGDTDMALSLLDVYVVNPFHINPRTEVLRAMASSLPIALCFDSHAEDLVIDGVSGWKHDAIEEAAAESWAQSCASVQRRRQFGRVGRELAASRWSISASARGLGDLIRDIRDAKKDRYLPNCGQ